MKLKHPKIIEHWIDLNQDSPPVMQPIPEDDPGDLVRKSNARRMKAWKERKRPYLEAYFTLIAAAAVLGGTAWAIYSAL
ncbi:hypothetical protein [Sinorhizobium chiapasense]|uniref:Transmembrane protein n=1 Tax=Sinorhizobium chiapasense TaxID=501572 RepID=A0ABZ2B9J6_9HYPH